MAVVITMSQEIEKLEKLETPKRIQKEVTDLAKTLNSVLQAVIHDRPSEVIVNKKEEPPVDNKGPVL